MVFKVGDNILFKKEKRGGVIIKINSLYKVKVRTSEGFEINTSVKDIILVDSLTDTPSAYGENILNKDLVQSKNRPYKKQRSKTILKIDLHIELLALEYQQLDNFSIVQIQLNECQNQIDYALNSKISKIIIVHGIGAGILREEVHKLLENYKLRYYLSKDGGSTEVMI